MAFGVGNGLIRSSVEVNAAIDLEDGADCKLIRVIISRRDEENDSMCSGSLNSWWICRRSECKRKFAAE